MLTSPLSFSKLGTNASFAGDSPLDPTALSDTISALSERMSYDRGVLSVSFLIQRGPTAGEALNRWLHRLPSVFIDGPKLFSSLVSANRAPVGGLLTRSIEWRFPHTVYQGTLKLLSRATGGYLLLFDLNLPATDGGQSEADLDSLRYAWAYTLFSPAFEAETVPGTVPETVSEAEPSSGDSYGNRLSLPAVLALIAAGRGALSSESAQNARSLDFLAENKPTLKVIKGIARRSGIPTLVLVDQVLRQARVAFSSALHRASVLEGIAAQKKVDVGLLYYHVNRALFPDVDPSWTAMEEGEWYCDRPQWVNVLKMMGGDGMAVDSKDVRLRLMRAWLDPHRVKKEKMEGVGFERLSLIPFLVGRSVPNNQALKHFSELGGIPKEELYAFIIDRHFPFLRVELKKWRKEKAAFYIHPRTDLALLAEYVKDPDTLGFVLWLHRKCLGLGREEMAARSHLPFHTYTSLEENTLSPPPTLHCLHRLADAASIPFDELDRLAQKSYPPNKVNAERARDGRALNWAAEPGSVREIILRAVGAIKIPEGAMNISQAFLEATGSEEGVTPAIFANMLHIPRETVAEEHLAAFLVAYGDRIDRASFWLRARPHLEGRAKDGVLTVPTGTTREDILGFSLAEALLKARLRLGLTRDEIARRAGYSSHRVVTTHEAYVFSAMEDDKIHRMAAALGMDDDRLLFVANNPWVLLAFPLRDDAGNILSRPDDPDLAYLVTAQGRARFERYFELRHACASFPLPDALKRRFAHSDAAIQDDELLLTLPHLDSASRLYLLEACCQAELYYFMGRDQEGEIDWSLSNRWDAEAISALDPLEIAQKIRSSQRWWSGTLGYSKNGKTLAQMIKKGLSSEQIARFVAAAHEHGFAHIPRKVFYLRFRGDFLANFVDWRSGNVERPEISRRLDGIGLARTLDRRGYGPVRVAHRDVMRRLNAHERRELLAHSTGRDRHAVARFLSEAHGRYFPSPTIGASVALTEIVSL